MLKTKSFFLWILLLLLFLSLVIPSLNSEKIWDQNLDLILSSPSIEHWFGTDALGRDLWTRVWSAMRLSLFLGFGVMSLIFVTGVAVGGFISFCPKIIQDLLMRLTEVVVSVPPFILISFLVIMLKSAQLDFSSVSLIVIGLSMTAWIPLARLTRNLVYAEKSKPYVEAARAVGAKDFRIFFRHLIPNILPVQISWVCLQLPQVLLLESSLSFLGLGVEPPKASLGVLMNDGWKNFLFAPHLLLIPAFFLWILIYSINEVFARKNG